MAKLKFSAPIIFSVGKLQLSVPQTFSPRRRRCCRAKLIFGYRRADTVTTMLRELALPTFDTLLFNSKQRYIRCRHNVHNSLVACVNACMH